MPQTRNKPKKKSPKKPPVAQTQQPAMTDVFTLAEAAAYLRLPEMEVMALVHAQGLPGRLVAGGWRFLKTAIQRWLSTGSPTPETRKAALLAIAGSWKGDPDLEAMVEEIYRRRGRPITEDGSYKLFHGLSRDHEAK